MILKKAMNPYSRRKALDTNTQDSMLGIRGLIDLIHCRVLLWTKFFSLLSSYIEVLTPNLSVFGDKAYKAYN